MGVGDGADGVEFGIDLRRQTVPRPAEVAEKSFEQVWTALRARTDAVRSVSDEVSKLQHELLQDRDHLRDETLEMVRAQGELNAAQSTLARHERVLGPLRKTSFCRRYHQRPPEGASRHGSHRARPNTRRR